MKLISIREASRRLNGSVSRSLLYALVRNGTIEGTNIAGKVLLCWASLRRLIADGRITVRCGRSSTRGRKSA